MRIVLCTSSPVLRFKLNAWANMNDDIDVVLSVSTLTEAYDFAEHHRPDCLIFSEALANCAEFELVEALLSTLGISSVIARRSAATPSHAGRPPGYSKSIVVQGDINEQGLRQALAAATRPIHQQPPVQIGSPKSSTSRGFEPSHLLLIGSSTGGVDALLRILSEFPEDCPPTLIVQHTGAHYAKSLIRLLDRGTPAQVVPATNGAQINQGHIYLAPDDQHHLMLCPRGTPKIMLSDQAHVSGHRPSVDALFSSAIDYAQNISAAILTGMGKDGADGICQLRKSGAKTFGQDEKTCVVYGMPRVAMEQGGIATQLPIQKIGAALLDSAREKV